MCPKGLIARINSCMAAAAVEAAGQALLDAPLQAANNVPQLLAKLVDPAAHDQARHDALRAHRVAPHRPGVSGTLITLCFWPKPPAQVGHVPGGDAKAYAVADRLCNQQRYSLQGALLTAVEALKLFFIDAAAHGQLPVAKLRKVTFGSRAQRLRGSAGLTTAIRNAQRSMQSLDAQVGAGPVGNGGDAAAQHAAWLARQLAAFEQRLLALLAGQSAVLQVRRRLKSRCDLQATPAVSSAAGGAVTTTHCSFAAAAAAYPLGHKPQIAELQSHTATDCATPGRRWRRCRRRWRS